MAEYFNLEEGKLIILTEDDIRELRGGESIKMLDEEDQFVFIVEIGPPKELVGSFGIIILTHGRLGLGTAGLQLITGQ